MFFCLMIAVLLICCFICIVNVHYRKIECKNQSEWKKNSVFNSPKAWGLYAAFFAILLGGLFIVSIKNVVTGVSNIGIQQDNINQIQEQQQDTSAQ